MRSGSGAGRYTEENAGTAFRTKRGERGYADCSSAAG